ncbi:ulp1 protease family, C-terminal catalytic domain-containing protein, partial [Tanacetum coccineum]
MEEHDMAGQNMVEQVMNEQDTNEQPEPQPQRKKRGIYSLKKKNRKQLNGVTFDEHGVAIGDDQSPFALYIGAVTKAKISILIDDWRKVPKIDKTQLWLEIKEHFRLKNDDCKTQVLKQCNHSWKSFKKDLRTSYMYRKLSPCDKYTFIEPNIWEEFVKMESTPEKMAKHALGKKWAKLKKNPPRLGPKGYRGNIDKWEKERASEELCTPVHKIPDRRGRYYCLARRVHDKVKGLMLSPEMQVIADKLIEAHTELINSSEVEDGVDPLIMVVGPEHGGRTRGVGHLVGFKKGIEGYVAKKRRYCEREKITEIVNKKIKEAREEMDAEYEEKLARAIKEMKSSQQQNENPKSPLMRKSSCDSESNFDVLDNIQEASKCDLFLPYGTMKVLCARGMVYPAKQVHGKSVLQGHAKVHVDNVEANCKDYILPVPTEEFGKLGETLFSFIQWPKKYMELTKASNSNQTGNKKIVAANTSTETATKQTVATNKESSTQKQTSPTLSRQEGPSSHIAAAPPTKRARPLNSASKEKDELIKKLNSYRGQIHKRVFLRSSYERWMRSPDPTLPLHVNVEPRVFGESKSFQFFVPPHDRMLLFTNGWLNSSIITLFATSIHKILQQVKTQSNKCGFLNPYTIQDSVCMFDSLLVKNYILQAMDSSQHKLFYLAPYVESKHWNLFIIVPQQNTGFILDSDMEGKNEESYKFTNVVQQAFGNMKWNLVECNQQRHYWECGYCLMKWMHQFVTHQQHSFPKTMPWNDKKPFTTKELDDIGPFMSLLKDHSRSIVLLSSRLKDGGDKVYIGWLYKAHHCA